MCDGSGGGEIRESERASPSVSSVTTEKFVIVLVIVLVFVIAIVIVIVIVVFVFIIVIGIAPSTWRNFIREIPLEVESDSPRLAAREVCLCKSDSEVRTQPRI